MRTSKKSSVKKIKGEALVQYLREPILADENFSENEFEETPETDAAAKLSLNTFLQRAISVYPNTVLEYRDDNNLPFCQCNSMYLCRLFNLDNYLKNERWSKAAEELVYITGGYLRTDLRRVLYSLIRILGEYVYNV